MKRMIGVAALLSLALALTTPGFSDTVTFSGPTGTVYGSLGDYGIFQATLTSPTMGNPDWVLDIETNYLNPSVPGGHTIPYVAFDTPTDLFGIGDFLIEWQGQAYGVVLIAHDGLQPGDLYSSDGFVTSDQIMHGLEPLATANDPVWLSAVGAILQGAGTLTITPTGNNGSNAANYEYLIQDVFAAPPDFLSDGDYAISVTSYACANGILQGSTGGNSGNLGGTPEPGTMLLVLPALLGLAYARRFVR